MTKVLKYIRADVITALRSCDAGYFSASRRSSSPTFTNTRRERVVGTGSKTGATLEELMAATEWQAQMFADF